MKISLSGYELEDAISLYLVQQFGKDLTVSVADDQEVTACIELSSMEVNVEGVSKEKHIHSAQESEEVKPKRTRRKKVEILDENDNSVSEEEQEIIEELVSEEKTKYSGLPRLNQEDQSQYTQILTLLSDNPRNKNRTKLEELTQNISEDLATVLKASEHYQDWLKYCEEQDSELAMKEILKQEEPELPNEENVIDTEPTEPVNKPEEEETPEQRNLRLMREVNEEVQKQEKQEIVEEETKPKLFSQNSSVSKTGSLFPSRKVFG